VAEAVPGFAPGRCDSREPPFLVDRTDECARHAARAASAWRNDPRNIDSRGFVRIDARTGW